MYTEPRGFLSFLDGRPLDPQEEWRQLADDRLANAQTVRREQVALTGRVNLLDTTAQDHAHANT